MNLEKLGATPKNDRELLEAAARAVGLDFDSTWHDEQSGLMVWEPDVFESRDWNPLVSDADAFRLAVALRLEIVPIEGGGVDVQRTTESEPFGVLLATEDGADPYTATRRAITRAAAAMAKEQA